MIETVRRWCHVQEPGSAAPPPPSRCLSSGSRCSRLRSRRTSKGPPRRVATHLPNRSPSHVGTPATEAAVVVLTCGSFLATRHHNSYDETIMADRTAGEYCQTPIPSHRTARAHDRRSVAARMRRPMWDNSLASSKCAPPFVSTKRPSTRSGSGPSSRDHSAGRRMTESRPRRGDGSLIDVGSRIGSEQAGPRPDHHDPQAAPLDLSDTKMAAPPLNHASRRWDLRSCGSVS